jgi:hypothetical protein
MQEMRCHGYTNLSFFEGFYINLSFFEKELLREKKEKKYFIFCIKYFRENTLGKHLIYEVSK